MQALSSLFNKITPALTNVMAPPQTGGGQLPPGFQPVRPVPVPVSVSVPVPVPVPVPVSVAVAVPMVQSAASGSSLQQTVAPMADTVGHNGAATPEPDLSHLTAEERLIIESVMRRQRQEEECELRKSNSVGGGSKVPFDAARRASDQTMLCALCRRTQFVGDSGNTCHRCGVKTCMRCGVRVSTRQEQGVWLCTGCRHRQPNVNANANATPLSVNGCRLAQRASPDRQSQDNGAATATATSRAGNPSMRRNAPATTGSYIANCCGPNGDSYTPRKTFQPPIMETAIAREVSTGSSTFVSSPDFEYNNDNCARSRYARQRQSAPNAHHYAARQFSENLANASTPSSLPRSRKLPNAPGPGRSASVAAMYNSNASFRPKYSLGSCSSEEEMYTTTECTSCDELAETESIMSERDAYATQRFTSLKEATLESIEYHRRSPCLVTWQRSADRTRLIGHMILKKNIPTHELVASGVTDANGLGLKVVGGKMTSAGVPGAFVTLVTPGGISDMIGRLRVGDQILEWNNQSLQGLSLDEVYQVILESKDDPQVEIIAQRSISGVRERVTDTLSRTGASVARSNSYRQHHHHPVRQRVADNRRQPLEPMSDDNITRKLALAEPCPIHDAERIGRIQIKLWLDEENGYLIVSVLSAFIMHSASGNAYCSLRLVPERGQVTTRRSKCIPASRDLRWNQTFVFPATSLNGVDNVSLEVSVCDEETNSAIGQTDMQLSDTVLNDEPAWFTLYRTQNEAAHAKRAGQNRRRADNASSYVDEAMYSEDDRQADVRRSLPAPSRQHSRSHSPNRHANVPEVESSEYESDVQRTELHQANSRSSKRSPVSQRRFKNSPHQYAAGSSPRNHPSASDGSKRSPGKEQNSFDIYERYQQLIEQSKRDRHSQPRSHSPSARARRQSHGSSRVQRENHVASDASESGVSESPQPSVQSVERSKRPTTLPMRPLSDVSEDAQSKDDSLRVSDASSQRTSGNQKQPIKGPALKEESTEAQKDAARRKLRKPYARSVSAESPDGPEEPAPAAPDAENGTAKDGNASDSGVATGSATSGNGNNAVADGQKTQTGSADQQSDGAKSNAPNASGAGQTGAKDASDTLTKRKQTDLPKKTNPKIGNRSSSSSNLQEKKGQFQRSEEVGRAAHLRAAGASKPDLSDTGGFIDGLGSGQIVGRQALGATCLGEIQLSLLDRKGSLEVEIIRCRNLAVPKNVAKVLPACYVKLYLMDKKQCLEKQRTNVSQKRTLEPVYQQKITFTEVYKERTLQVMIWGDYARTDRKVFMGVAQINLGALDLRKCTLEWYKLYPANSIVGGVAE